MIMVHGDDHKMIECFIFGKEEREKQNGLKAKVYVIGANFFCTQDTIEGMSDLGLIVIL
jgi:hypothetical protein